MTWFNFLFNPVFSGNSASETHKTFILEPILTPSGIVDALDEGIDFDGDGQDRSVENTELELDNDLDDTIEDPSENTVNDGDPLPEIPDEDIEEIPFIYASEEDPDGESGQESLEATRTEEYPTISSDSEIEGEGEITDEVEDLALVSDSDSQVDGAIAQKSVASGTAEELRALSSDSETEVDGEAPAQLSALAIPEDIVAQPKFDSGYFVVGETGEIEIDYLFDGGKYKGELGIFSLGGMEDYDPDTEDFIAEAARRSNSNSELGHIIISDRTEGARFSGELTESDHNSGEYQGIKTFNMRSGDSFGMMLVPKGSVQRVLDNPGIGGAARPLFSLATANPDDGFHMGQVADVTGEGNVFVFEDLRVDGKSDGDYNDLIFRVNGATGKAAHVDDVIDTAKEWRDSDLGQALIEYTQPFITQEPIEDVPIDPVEPPEVEITDPTSFEFPEEDQPLIGIIDQGISENPDIDTERITLGKDRIDHDNNPLVEPEEDQSSGTHSLGLIAATEDNQPEDNEPEDNEIDINGINDDAPLWIGRAESHNDTWAESLIEFVDEAKESDQPNAVINIGFQLTQTDTEGNTTTRYELTETERQALEYAQENQVIIVAAAGNDGGVMSALGQASQEFDNIITVGAVENVNPEVAPAEGFERVEYSNYGPGLDIVAEGGTPENPIVSTVGDGTGTLAGTSVATAKVTGTASVVWAANPDLNYQQVIEIIKSTATDLEVPNPDIETGAGLVNIEAAVYLAKSTEPIPLEPVDNPPIGYEPGPGVPIIPNPPEVQPNRLPEDLIFLVDRFYNPNEPIQFMGQLIDADGASDIERIDFWVRQDGGEWVDINDVTEFSIDPENPQLAQFEYQPEQLNEPSHYDLKAVAYDSSGVPYEAFTETFTILSLLPGVELSDRVRWSLERSTNLKQYDPQDLAATQQWIVSVRAGHSAPALASQFNATSLRETGHIPNTHIWKFPVGTNPETIAQELGKNPLIEFAYPLVPIEAEFFANLPWHIQNTATPGIDTSVKTAWDTHQVNGNGVVIGIVDDGFDSQHPDLASNYNAGLSKDFDTASNSANQPHGPDSKTLKTRVSYSNPELIYPNKNKYHLEYNPTRGTGDSRLDQGRFSGILQDLALNLDLTHAQSQDLTITLKSPWDTEFTLQNLQPGAKTYPIDVFNGETINAEVANDKNNKWTLIVENTGGTIGTLNEWSLDFILENHHGTPVAGVAVGATNETAGSSGVAPGASWAGLRIGSDDFLPTEIADALSHNNQEIDIYNNSWGMGFFSGSPGLAQAAIENGILEGRDSLGSAFVFAGGNSGRMGDNVNYNPFANSRHTIAVTAVNQDGKQAIYSTPGAPILVSAPSEDARLFSYQKPNQPPETITAGNTVQFPLDITNLPVNIDDLQVSMNLDHNQYEDLSVSLVQVVQGQEKQRVKLFEKVPFTKKNRKPKNINAKYLSITLDDLANRTLPVQEVPFHGSFKPQDSLDLFSGEEANGTWILEIENTGTETGTFYDWSMALNTDGITTTDIQGQPGITDGNHHTSFGGTSASAPMVSGVIALMLDANDQLTSRDIQHILIASADKNDPQDPDWTTNLAGYEVNHKYGFGLINAEKAVALAKNWTSVNPEDSIGHPFVIPVDKTIPDNDPAGVKAKLEVQESMDVEWVEVMVDIVHDDPDNLKIELVHIDVNGNESKSLLANPYKSPIHNSEDLNQWVFTSPRHWGEDAQGTWEVRVSDEDGTAPGGFWKSWQLNIHGTEPIPVNHWNARFINRTPANYRDINSYDFSNPDAVLDLGEQSQNGKIRLVQDWGDGSPHPNVQNDLFAMEAWTRVSLDSNKLYRLHTDSDDGTLFKFKNVKTGEWIEDNYLQYWLRGAFAQRTMVFKVPESGEYDFYTYSHENTLEAKVDVTLEEVEFFQEPVNTDNEWEATFFSLDRSQSQNPPGDLLANGGNLNDAIGTVSLGSNLRTDGRNGIQFNWGTASPNINSKIDYRFPDDRFAILAHTAIEPGRKYRTFVRGDDGFQLLARNNRTGEWQYITPQNQWQYAYGAHQAIDFTIPQDVSFPNESDYDFYYHFYEGGIDTYLDLSWEPISFTGTTIATIGANVRSGPSTQYSKVGEYSYGSQVTFDKWVKGQYIDLLNDPAIQRASDVWYRIQGTNNWISAAIVNGLPQY